MEKLISKLTMLLATALFAWACPVHAQQMVSNDNEDEVNKVEPWASQAYRPGEVIVKFKETSAARVRSNAKGQFKTSGVSQVDKVLNALGVTEADQLMPRMGKQVSRRAMRSYSGKPVTDRDMSGLYRLRFDESKAGGVDQAIEQIKAIADVEYAEPNYLVFAMADNSATYTAEPLYSYQWGPAKINLPQLWDMPLLEGASRPIIAILDTGVDITHPDLADNIWTNAREANGADYEDDDNNGFADDLHGWDFINQCAAIADYNGHGTHCAGIAAAVGNNGIGVTGANPDAIIMPITVMQSDGTGDVATIIQGIDYAVANGATFLSMSFGGYTYSVAEEQALAKAYAKATLVAAAGNDHADLNIPRCPHILGKGPVYPAMFTFVLGIEASNDSGLAGFSNFDCDGPIYSRWGEERLYNVELRAPGSNIYSTYPNGRYKNMSGTSMACPLAAGAISRLMQCKSYEYQVINREILFGDLIHSANQQTGIMDILAAYNITDADREPTLWLVATEFNDETFGDGDLRPDAGEIIDLYPTIRNDWGNATNITLHLGVGENEDETIIEPITNDVAFGNNLSSYGKAKSANPLRFKIRDNCADNRHIRLRISAIFDENPEPTFFDEVVIVVENGVELGGVITEDMILYPNKHYIVTKPLGIPEGKTLTILPGTRLEFNSGSYIQDNGKLIAEGKPDSVIVFKNHIGHALWGGIRAPAHHCDTISYCIIENECLNGNLQSTSQLFLKDCVVSQPEASGLSVGRNYAQIAKNGIRTNFFDCYGMDWSINGDQWNFCNYSNYHYAFTPDPKRKLSTYNRLGSSNVIYCPDNVYICGQDLGMTTDHSDYPSWLGSGNEAVVRRYIYDSMNPNVVDCLTFVDLSNMPTRPYSEAHGIVWKVEVDGYDAQDEFDLLPPLGVGRHEFKVFFNREMDHNTTPTIAMGVRPPYTQILIAEDGVWSHEDDVDVYIAHLDITGKLQSNGLNRIYVADAKDNEFFVIPTENIRFNVLVQTAGSMATGFFAEAGLGKVELTWNNENNNFEDAMGFNVYRYQLSAENDTINRTRLNDMIIDIETDEYTDYEVTPGETYYYYYKVLSTDLKEYDISNVVAATPLTSTLGDANGSGDVDVADVITTVNYAAGMEPRPFIFEAADVNFDSDIDILDVIGIIRIISNPGASTTAINETPALYTIEDGIVYVDTPVSLAGVQVMVNAARNADITVAEELKGFERVSTWTGDNDYLFLAYNMAGRTLDPGKHALLNIGNRDVVDVRLSDASGHNVKAILGTMTGIDDITNDDHRAVRNGIYDLMGRRMGNQPSDLRRLPGGIYIVNGVKTIKK